jgi:hypothetical protein
MLPGGVLMDINAIGTGPAILIVFILYLIDRHNLWKAALKVATIIGAFMIAILAIDYGYREAKRIFQTSEANAEQQLCLTRNNQLAFDYVVEKCRKNPNVTIPHITMVAPDGREGEVPIENEDAAIRAGFRTKGKP